MHEAFWIHEVKRKRNFAYLVTLFACNVFFLVVKAYLL
jgi:hypothetical protein